MNKRKLQKIKVSSASFLNMGNVNMVAREMIARMITLRNASNFSKMGTKVAGAAKKGRSVTITILHYAKMP